MLNILYWALAIAPSIVCLWFVLSQYHGKLSWLRLIGIFVTGALMVFVAAYCETLIGVPAHSKYIMVNQIVYYFFVVGLCEEISKWISVKLFVRDRLVNHPYEYIVYTVTASVGFATLENILYLRNVNFWVAGIRAVTSVPGHVINTVFMGIFMGFAYKSNNLVKKMLCNVLSVAVATITHGLYNCSAAILRSCIVLLIFTSITTTITICVLDVVSRQE